LGPWRKIGIVSGEVFLSWIDDALRETLTMSISVGLAQRSCHDRHVGIADVPW
jgi:hypothetical protein